MRTHSTPLQLYQAQKASFQAATGSARASWRQIPEGAYRDFKELTEGGISSAQLRRMGHPYARVAGRNDKGKVGGFHRRGASKSYIKTHGLKGSKQAAPLLPVNRQKGDLNRSVTLWHRSSVYSLEASVGFDKGKAGRSIFAVQPKGTKRVVPRGIWTEIRKRGMARARAWRDVYERGQRAAFMS